MGRPKSVAPARLHKHVRRTVRGALLFGTGSSARRSGLCEDRAGWDGGRVGARCKTEGIDVYVQLIHFVV